MSVPPFVRCSFCGRTDLEKSLLWPVQLTFVRQVGQECVCELCEPVRGREPFASKTTDELQQALEDNQVAKYNFFAQRTDVEDQPGSSQRGADLFASMI